MRPQLKQLSLLVARWRKIELNTWPQALAARERTFHARALKLFFPLFALVMVKMLPTKPDQDIGSTDQSSPASSSSLSAVTLTSADACISSAEMRFEAYLAELHSGLEQFIQSCAVGEFGTRLEMLASMQAQLDVEISAGIAAPVACAAASNEQSLLASNDRLTLTARQRLSHTLFNVRMYYAQFLPLVQAHLAARRAPIAKKLADTVRLAPLVDLLVMNAN